MLKKFKKDKLVIKVCESKEALGICAAVDGASVLKKLLSEKTEVNVIFAAAPSQDNTVEALIATPGIEWERINAFHMDEYIGLPKTAPQRFAQYLEDRLFSKLPFKSVNKLNGSAVSAAEECKRYGALLEKYPVDVVFLGIGENGHIAFNDPSVADFDDKVLVKIVELDPICRQQQVNDGCFASIDLVPTHAMSLTIPALTNGKYLFCSVPNTTKAWAVNETVTADITKAVPSTIMRKHDNAIMYVDINSAAQLKK